MRVATKKGAVTLGELLRQFGESLHGDWQTFKAKYDELLGSDFYEVLVPRSETTAAKLGPLAPFLRESPVSLEELRATVLQELQEKGFGLKPEESGAFWSYYRDTSFAADAEGSNLASQYLKTLVLDKAGKPLVRFRGKEGLVHLADEAFLGSMSAPFRLSKENLDTSVLRELGWGSGFRGSTQEYQRTITELTSPEGLQKYQGIAGYVQYAKDFEGESLKKASMNASAALSPAEFKRLNWPKEFAGTPEKLEQTRRELTSTEGIQKYQGIAGYVQYAKDFERESLKKASMNASAALSPAEFKRLNWPKAFAGTPEKFEQTRRELTSPEGIQKYQGMAGYVQYAKDFESGSLQKASMNASAALSLAEFKRLNWPKSFAGTPEKLEQTRRELTSPEGLKKYQGSAGYARYATDFEGGNTKRAHRNARSALTEEDFQALGWGPAR